MAERDRAAIEELVRRVLLEKLGGNGPRVKKVEVPRLDVAAEHRMDPGNPADRVWTRDLFTLEEAPRLGCGLMVMERTTFPWTLTYDEMDYVIEGRLDILVDGEFVLAQRNLDLRFRGSENQRILDVPQSLAQGRAVWCTAARWVGERQS